MGIFVCLLLSLVRTLCFLREAKPVSNGRKAGDLGGSERGSQPQTY